MIGATMRINMDLCFRCAACVSVCPEDAIDVTEFSVKVSGSCNDCGICEKICPVEAIILKESGQ